MRSRFIIAVCCLALVASYTPVEASSVGFNCNSAQNAYTVNGYFVSPWPPIYNSNLAVSMTGVMNSNQQVSGWVFTVKLGANTEPSGMQPLQAIVSQGQVYNVSTTGYIPPFQSPGSYSVQSQLQSSSGQFLNCWQFNFQLA